MKNFLTLTLVLFLSLPAFAESKDDYPYYAKITCDALGVPTDIDNCFYYFDPKRPATFTGITLTNLKNGTTVEKIYDSNFDSFRDIGYFVCPKNGSCGLYDILKYQTFIIDLPPDTRLIAENAKKFTLIVELYERSTEQLLFKASTNEPNSIVIINTLSETIERLRVE